jgi:predicted ATPase/class 3 adenylate cyclase
MFCDLVGSTALSARLDPEDLRDVIGAYHKCAAETVARFDGYVAKYMGDGVLVYFGYPQAHEDDAERAVRAGLALIDAVGRLVAPEPLQVRAGIASGLVVVGDLVEQGDLRERSVVGDTPNLASRLQGLAEANAVVIGPQTHQLVADLFEYRDLGAIQVKGFADPLHAYRVLRPSAIESRFEALHGTALTPLVGREEEVELLLRRWQHAKSGEGRVVLLSGEAGIGKSRIAAAVRERIMHEPHTRVRYFGSPHHQDSALHPIIAQLERAAEFDREDAPEAKLKKLEALLAPTLPPDEDVALLAELLSIPITGRYSASNLTPQRRKEKTLQALLRQLELLAKRQPTLIVYEDLHWIDPTSLELLSLTVERVHTQQVLLLATARLEFVPPWPNYPHISTVSLGRLDRSEVTALVASVAKGKSLPSEVLDQIVSRTDGVPLFTEELTKAVIESGMLREADERYELTGPLPPLAIPSTLHASLLARLDRLAPVKDVAQIGAAIGREFPYNLLAAVSGLPERNLRSALTQLVDAALIFQRGLPPHSTYLFKHALVQDATYTSLLKSRRQQLHATIARVLEESFPEISTTEPERVAHHYMQAGLLELAVTFWRRAGELAISRSAIFEAAAHLEHGLEALSKLPNDPNHKKAELELRLALASAWISTKSWAALEVQRECERARELAEQVGDTTNLIRSTWGIWANQWVRDDVSPAVVTAQQLLKLSETRENVMGRWIGHCMVGMSSFQLSAFSTAREQFEEALALDDLEQARIACTTTGHDIGVPILSYFSRTLATLGYLHQAKLRGDELLERGHALGHKPSHAYACNGACILSWILRDTTGLASAAGRLRGIVAEDKFPLWLAYSSIYTGWLEIEAGSPEIGCRLIDDGLSKFDTLGHICNQYFVMLLLANGQLRSGKVDNALDTVDRAEKLIKRTGSKAFEAEVHRLRGDLQLARTAKPEAETSYLQALEIARSQNAKLWEIRAAISLGHLWRNQAKRSEARDLLAPVYGWFTEGFDMPDLKEAKALLDELA